MYHYLVLDKVLSYIRRHGLLRPGDRVGVAVSGGADSVALLRLLLEARDELGIVLSVVHFNHKIRGADADADEHFVRELARAHDLLFHASSADAPAFARQHHLSLEAAARKLRYSFFDTLLEDALDRVATAHTRDDQAETVLLRLLRGAGTRGLAAIAPAIRAPDGVPRVVRPLLEIPGQDLRDYLRRIGQPWREDATNRDLSLARNRLRHELLPALRRLNLNLDQVLAETAEIARAEEDSWQRRVRAALPKVVAESTGDLETAISVASLLRYPLAMQRRLLRAAAERLGLRLEFRHVEEMLELARSPASRAEKSVELPHHWLAVRSAAELRFSRRCPKQPADYDCALLVPGEVRAAGVCLRASLLPAGAARHDGTSAVLLDPALAAGLRVRNWRPGDRYWPLHSAAPKKLKELLQARHIPRRYKPHWPVVVHQDKIVWVPGFAPPKQSWTGNQDSLALLLEELPLPEQGEVGP